MISKKQIAELDIGYIDGYQWLVRKQVSYRTDIAGVKYVVIVNPGFITDGASASYFKAFISPLDRRWAIPSIIHDGLYTVQKPNKKISDIIFLDGMHDCIEAIYADPRARIWHQIKAYGAYQATNWLGQEHWDSPEEESQQSLVEVWVDGAKQ